MQSRGIFITQKTTYRLWVQKCNYSLLSFCDMFFLWSLYSQLLEIRANDKYDIFSHWDDGWEFQHLVNICCLIYVTAMVWVIWLLEVDNKTPWVFNHETMGISIHYIKRPSTFEVKTAKALWQQLHSMVIQKHTCSKLTVKPITRKLPL